VPVCPTDARLVAPAATGRQMAASLVTLTCLVAPNSISLVSCAVRRWCARPRTILCAGSVFADSFIFLRHGRHDLQLPLCSATQKQTGCLPIHPNRVIAWSTGYCLPACPTNYFVCPIGHGPGQPTVCRPTLYQPLGHVGSQYMTAFFFDSATQTPGFAPHRSLPSRPGLLETCIGGARAGRPTFIKWIYD